jgi:ferritin-like metal-binding protein YciE
MATSVEEQLVKYLADAHSVEVQALAQMRGAPGLAGDTRLAAAFREHLIETEGHERTIRARLEALGADPSRLKDAAGRGGGRGMLLFARSQPDTSGKLTAHAFSYEHMEVATYGLLNAAARIAGDPETADAAATIGAEEKRMADRLASLFDVAVEASLSEVTAADLDAHLDRYLKDAHALERQADQLLRIAPRLVDDGELAGILASHLLQTRGQLRRVGDRLRARDSRPSRPKDLALRAGALNIGAFFAAQPDTTVKLAGFAYAFENLEVAGYQLLRRVAERASDPETATMAAEISAEESATAELIAGSWEQVVSGRMGGMTGALSIGGVPGDAAAQANS